MTLHLLFVLLYFDQFIGVYVLLVWVGVAFYHEVIWLFTLFTAWLLLQLTVSLFFVKQLVLVDHHRWLLRLSHIKLYLVYLCEHVLGCSVHSQSFLRFNILFHLLTLLHKVFEMAFLRCSRDLLRRWLPNLLLLLSGCSQFVMIPIKHVLLMQKGVRELLLHRAFAQELLNSVFENFFVQQLVNVWPLVRVLAQHLVHEATKLVREMSWKWLKLTPDNLHGKHVDVGAIERRLQRTHFI